MEAADCREYANRCVEMGNEAVTQTVQSRWFKMAQAWLRFAEELVFRSHQSIPKSG